MNDRATNMEPKGEGGRYAPGDLHIRWLKLRDRSEVLAIEAESFEFPWGEGDLIQVERQANCILMVAEHDERVVGFMAYELKRGGIQLLNLAVAPDYRHLGVGTRMADKLIGKLSLQRRTHIATEVCESNLSGQLFFRACGFEAVSIARDFYEDTPEDAYVFVYRLAKRMFAPTNRIKGLMA